MLVFYCSVTALETRHYVVGSKIEMKLMKKLRGSTRVLPASDWSLNGCFPSKVNGMYLSDIS